MDQKPLYGEEPSGSTISGSESYPPTSYANPPVQLQNLASPPPQVYAVPAPQVYAAAPVAPVVQKGEVYHGQRMTIEVPFLFPESPSANFLTNSDQPLIRMNEQLRKVVIIVYDFTFLLFNILFITVMFPIAIFMGIAKSGMMFFITSSELVLDSIASIYEVVYKMIRPSLIFTRIILDVIQSFWGCRRDQQERRHAV